jgi:hypothetical protein
MTLLVRASRKPRAPRLAATAVAIRNGLAVSAAVLALSGSGVAFAAGTCAPSATATVSCNGDFGDTVNNSINPGDIVTDLTLVLGDVAPTTVTPSFGAIGVVGNWDGAVGITTYADIRTYAAEGVLAYGDTVTLNNHGHILTYAASYGDEAVEIRASGNAEVDNIGSIYNLGYWAPVTAVNEVSYFGTAHLDNEAGASITAVDYVYNATGAVVSAFSDEAHLENAGTISASSTFGYVHGAEVHAGYGASLANSGVISADSTYSQAFGAYLTAVNGNIGVDNSGAISASGRTHTVGLQARSIGYGAVTVDNSGSVTVESEYAGAQGVVAYSHGQVYFENSATGQVDARGGSYAEAVVLTSAGSGVDFDNDGDIYALGGPGNDTFAVLATGTGNVYLDNSGTIRAYTYGNAFGVSASVTGSYALLDFDNTGNIVAYSALDDATAVTLDTSGMYSAIDALNDGGITAISYGSSGTATGIEANTAVSGSDINVVNGDDGTITADAYYNATGVHAIANGFYGNDAGVQNSGSISASSYAATAYGVLLKSYNGTASLDNTVDGSIEAYSTHGNAIGAEFDGNYATAYNHGTISATAAYYGVAAGLTVGAYFGDALLDNSGSITATGGNALGVQAGSVYGSATLENSGTIIATGSVFAAGATANAYVVTVNNSGSISASATSYTRGLVALGGDLYIDNSGEVSASAYSFAAVGIRGERIWHRRGLQLQRRRRLFRVRHRPRHLRHEQRLRGADDRWTAAAISSRPASTRWPRASSPLPAGPIRRWSTAATSRPMAAPTPTASSATPMATPTFRSPPPAARSWPKAAPGAATASWSPVSAAATSTSSMAATSRRPATTSPTACGCRASSATSPRPTPATSSPMPATPAPTASTPPPTAATCT